MKAKKIFGVLWFFLTFCSALLFAEGYRIAEVRYDLTGRTKAYALDLAVPIDKGRIFPTHDALDAYVAQIKIQLRTQRVLKESDVTYEVKSAEDDALQLVTLTVTAADSHNLVIVPYPKYDSNGDTPFELKLKLKDYNFLGLMQTLNFDINWESNFQENNKFGFNLDYAFPFKAGPLNAQWLNDWTFSDNFFGKKNEIEFNFNTGLRFVLPLKRVDLEFIAKQYFVMDQGDSDDPLNYYKERGDSFYMTEYLGFSAPLTLFQFKNLSHLYFTPYLNFTYNWDQNGIVSPDLRNETLAFGATINTGSITWDGNFRKGFTFSFGPSLGYNFAFDESDRFIISLDAGASAFFSWWNRLGLATRMQAFTYFPGENATRASTPANSLITTKKIGGSLRGIRDEQAGIKTPAAFIVNLDIPVRLFTTDWRGWGAKLFKRNMPNWFHVLDFELQVSPFFDMALTHNAAVENNFAGWYSAGFELLVYPERWRSLVVRLSLGADILQNNLRPWQQEPYYPLSSLGDKVFTEITFGVGWFF